MTEISIHNSRSDVTTTLENLIPRRNFRGVDVVPRNVCSAVCNVVCVTSERYGGGSNERKKKKN